MGTFAYIARDPAGQKVEGKVAAATAQAVLADLQSRQLAPVQVREVAEQPRAQRRMSPRKLATAYRQLADLLRAGVPLLRGLRLLGRSKSNPRLARVMSAVGNAVADGTRLADAMAAHGEVFPDIQIAMVRAGERGGFLEPVLRRMGAFLEEQADLRAKVVGNLIYPITLLVFMVAVIVVALVGIVPKFRDFYSRITLPWPTKALLAASDACTSYGLVILLIAGVIGFAMWRVTRSSAVRRQLSIWQLRIPGVGAVVKNLAVGRFARILGTLLENGIPMLQAMQISRGAAGHVLLAEAIDSAAEAVRSGEALATPFSASGLFAEDVIEMIRVGESANNLPQVLITVAETIEKRIDRMLTVLVRLMEPALLAIMGGAVFFIFVALIVPMMRMSSSFQH
jgi:general secretion pathway protein F